MTLLKIKNDNIPTRKSANLKKKREVVYYKNGDVNNYTNDICSYNKYHSNSILRERKKEMMRRNIRFVREFERLCKIVY